MITLYRLLLFAYPPRFRRRFGDELIASFAGGLVERRRRGVRAAVSYAIACFADALESGLSERRSERRRRRAEPGARLGIGLLQDVRFGLRLSRRRPSFAALAIVTLALGIGSGTAAFTAFDAILLRPLPYRDADRLVRIETENTKLDISQGPASYSEFLDWRASGIFEDAGVYLLSSAAVRIGSGSERVPSGSASASLFTTLGVQPILGRLPTAEEDRPSAQPVVLLTENIWRLRFNADPAVVGTTIDLDGKPLVIVGVLPASFVFERSPEIWMTFEASSDLEPRANRYLDVVARLAPETGLDRVNSQLAALSGNLAHAYAESSLDWRAIAVAWKESQVGGSRSALVALMVSVGLLLAIACCNVGIMLLVRGAGRHREVAVRAALGASRRRIIRQLLIESVVLSAAAGLLGVLLARVLVAFAVQLAPAGVPRLQEIAIDPRVLWFAVALSATTALAFGLAPALHASGAASGLARDSGWTSTAGRRRARWHRWLLFAEAALTVVLLIGASLLVKSLARLTDVDTGFEARRLLTFHLPLPAVRYLDGDGYRRDYVQHYFDEVIRELEALPAVESAAATIELPLAGGGYRLWQGFEIMSRPRASQAEALCVGTFVTPGYFETMGIPLVVGRLFSDGAEPPVAIVSETFAKKFLPGTDPVGQSIRFGDAPATFTIVGVVGDVRADSLDSEPLPQVYKLFSQDPKPFMAVVVRTGIEPGFVVHDVRLVLERIDAGVPPYRMRTGEELLNRTTSARRFGTTLVSAFAAAALVLGLIGASAVVSHVLAESRREIGLRLALGASRGDIVRMLLARGVLPTGAGMVAGVAFAALTTRQMEGLLFEVSPVDAPVFVLVSAVVVAVTLVACAVPARLALRVDPALTLRDS